MMREGPELHGSAAAWPEKMVGGEQVYVEAKGHHGYHRAFVQRGPHRDWFHVTEENGELVPAYTERYAYVGDMKKDRTFEAQHRVDGVTEHQFKTVTL